MYRILPLEDDFVELCDECGYDGGLVDMGAAAALLTSLRDRWGAAFSHSEDLLRERPAPETWCSVEYAQHTAAAIRLIEWAAHQFVDGCSPDWSEAPGHLADGFEHDEHKCGQFEVEATLDALESAANSMATFAIDLTPEQQGRTADYRGGLVINAAAVLRHAVHDAEHHLLDIRRGVAGLRLQAT